MVSGKRNGALLGPFLFAARSITAREGQVRAKNNSREAGTTNKGKHL